MAATVDDQQWVEYPADASDEEPMEGWLLRVVGKGQKAREVPLPADAVAELARYLVSRGLDADPEDFGNQGAHLLGKASDAAERAPGLHAGPNSRQAIDPRQGIAATTFYNQIKRFFEDCAGVLRGQGDAKGAERFDKASTHWMRHSHASHAIASGMPIEIAQQNLGHASLSTTTIYVTTERRRHEGCGSVLGQVDSRAAGDRPGSRRATGKQPLAERDKPTRSDPHRLLRVCVMCRRVALIGLLPDAQQRSHRHQRGEGQGGEGGSGVCR